MEITITIQGAIPAEVREALRELYAQGTPGEPMEAQPVDVQQYVEQDALPPLPKSATRRYRQSYTKQENETIVDLYNKGYSWDEIADYLGRKTGNSIRTQFCTYRKLKSKED